MPILGAFAPLMVALMALLVGLALWIFANITARLLRQAPVVGGWIAGRVEALGASIASTVINDFDAVTADAGWAFAAISRWAWNLLYSQSAAVAHAVKLAAAAESDAQQAWVNAYGSIINVENNLAGLIRDEIAGVEHDIAVTAQNAYNSAVNVENNVSALARGLFATAEADITSAESSVLKQVSAVEGVLGSQIQAVADALNGDVSTLIQQIHDGLVADIATAEQAIAAAQAAANAYAAQVAATAAGTALGALDQAAHDLVIGPWEALLPALGAVAGALSPATAGALNIPQVLTEPVPLSIPGILSLVVPALGAVTTEVESCLVPNCDALNQWGNILRGLTDAAMWALLLALLSEVVSDPGAAAADISAVVGGLVDPIATGLLDLIGA